MRGFLLILLPALAWSATLPAGTELHIRLTKPINSASAEPGEKVHAVLIAPVAGIPPGAQVEGTVSAVEAAPTAANATEEHARATMLLDFNQIRLGDRMLPMHTRLSEVENARESVDESGRIVGLSSKDMLTNRIEQGIQKLGQRYSGLAGLLEGVRGAVLHDADPNIAYDAGVEMTLALKEPLMIQGPPARGPELAPFPNQARLITLVRHEPFQTYALRPPHPSDITNLMFIGTQDDLEGAFAAAGWSGAARLNGMSKFETAIAIIEQRGYKEAPVSVLTLDERPPDLVFQKGTNTFAARHHLRIWRTPDTFNGEPVWVSSATHDTGIDYSEQNMTFIHKIDSRVDRERDKAVNDLIFAGKVRSYQLVDRPNVPRASHNATGDAIETDGRMAVLLLAE